SLTVLEKAGSPGSTSALATVPLARAAVTSGRIDELFAARAIAGHPERLLGASLRVPEGTVFAQEQVGPGAGVESKIIVRFADAALAHPMEIPDQLLFLVTFIHEAPDVRSGVASFAEQSEVPLEEALERALPAIERALLGGLLEVRPAG